LLRPGRNSTPPRPLRFRLIRVHLKI